VTKALMRTLLIFAAATAGLAAGAEQVNEWTAAGGAWGLYRKNCSGCHGFQGQGIPPVGTPLKGNPFVVNARAEDLKAVVRNGRKGKDKRYGEYLKDGEVGFMNMPPFELVILNERELDLLVSYLKGGFQRGEFNQQ